MKLQSVFAVAPFRSWPQCPGLIVQLQLYTAKSQYWLHKAGASPEHINNLRLIIYSWNFNENIKLLN